MFQSSNVTVMVGDIDKSLAFYTEVLSLPAGVRHGEHYAEVLAPGVVIGLHPKRGNSREPVPDSNLSIGFQVKDMKQTVAVLQLRGVSFTRQENDTNKFAFFRDIDGTALYLLQPKAS